MTVPPIALGHRILRAGLVVSAAHALFKLAGLIQLKVMGHCLDGRTIDVVYVTVFEGCLFSLFLLGEEVIGPAFLPVFMEQKETQGQRRAWAFANLALTVQCLLLIALTLVVMLFPGAVVRLLTAWDAGSDPAKFRLAVRSLVWMGPALICLSLGSTTYMLLNGYKRFFLAAFGDASLKLMVIVFVLAGLRWLGPGWKALVFGLLAGSAAKLLTHLVGLRRELRLLRPRLALRDPAFKTMLLLMLPLICGIVFAKIRDVFNNVWVLSHLTEDGLMQANAYGRKLYLAIGWLIPYALSIAMFPFLCEMVDRKDHERLGLILTTSCRMLLSVFVPLAMVAVVLAHPLTFLIFHGGQFGARVASWTSVAVACYTLVLPAAAVEYLLMQAFFAHRRMVAVTAAGIVFSALSMLISLAGVVWLGATGPLAVAVIGLGFALSRTLKSTALVLLLKRSVACFPARATLAFLGRVALVGILAAGAAHASVRGLDRWLLDGVGKPALLIRLAAGGLASGAVFVPAVLLLRVREPALMLDWARRKLRPAGSGPARNRGD